MTGWIMVDGKWYYMNQVVQAATWVLGSDGKWAFAGNTAAVPFGAMLADTVTPDGYRVDASGQWIQ